MDWRTVSDWVPFFRGVLKALARDRDESRGIYQERHEQEASGRPQCNPPGQTVGEQSAPVGLGAPSQGGFLHVPWNRVRSTRLLLPASPRLSRARTGARSTRHGQSARPSSVARSGARRLDKTSRLSKFIILPSYIIFEITSTNNNYSSASLLNLFFISHRSATPMGE